MIKKTIKEEKPKIEKTTFYEGVGRRKETNARVRLYVTESAVTVDGISVKKGEIYINSRPVEKYFSGEISTKVYLEPLRSTNTLGRFAITVVVKGGGTAGQLAGFVHGLSRALEKVDKEKFRPILKKKGFLTRDSRAKERRKAGFAQKARARKQSPKR